MVDPFAIDTYLPSFREMETSLDASALEIQQSLTAFLLPFALMSLWHGHLRCARRRRVILIALTSVACALAPTIHALWFFRALQGIAAGIPCTPPSSSAPIAVLSPMSVSSVPPSPRPLILPPIFLYITSAPVFLLRHLHLHETQFYWLFLPIPAGMMLGAALSGRLAGRLSPRRTVWLGTQA